MWYFERIVEMVIDDDHHDPWTVQISSTNARQSCDLTSDQQHCLSFKYLVNICIYNTLNTSV